MQNLNKFAKYTSVTEKIFLLVVFILVSVLTFNVAEGKAGLLLSAYADTDENSTSSGDSDSGSTEDSEKSVDDEESTPSVDEEESVASVEDDEESTPSTVEEKSTLSEQEVSEVSVVVSTQETSVRSGANIEAFDNVEVLNDNVAIVTINKKLFFLFPVDISQTVSLDDDGNVLDVRQTLLNTILSWLSF